MRSPRFNLLCVALAALIAACGSTAPQSHVSSPAPRKLRLVTAADRAQAALAPQRPTTYVLDGTLADLGPQAPVRKLIGRAVSDTDVAHLAEVLGLHGTPVRTESGYAVHDGDGLLTVDTSGGAPYVDYSSTGGAAATGGGTAPDAGSANASTGVAIAPPPAVTPPPTRNGSAPATPPDVSPAPVPPEPIPPPPVPPVPVPPVPAPPVPAPPVTVPPTTGPPPVDVPGPDDAAHIAQSVLDSLGVLAGNQWAHDVTDANATISSCAPEAQCDVASPPVTARTVTFELLLGDVRVPGIDWSVTIGEHRRVESVSGTWAHTEGAGAYPLRTTANVFDDLQHGRAQYVGAQPMMSAIAPEIAPGDNGSLPSIEAHVTGVALGAARWDGTESSNPVVYIVPTYRFRVRVPDGDPYDIELLALDPANFVVGASPIAALPKNGVEPDHPTARVGQYAP